MIMYVPYDHVPSSLAFILQLSMSQCSSEAWDLAKKVISDHQYRTTRPQGGGAAATVSGAPGGIPEPSANGTLEPLVDGVPSKAAAAAVTAYDHSCPPPVGANGSQVPMLRQQSRKEGANARGSNWSKEGMVHGMPALPAVIAECWVWSKHTALRSLISHSGVDRYCIVQCMRV